MNERRSARFSRLIRLLLPAVLPFVAVPGPEGSHPQVPSFVECPSGADRSRSLLLVTIDTWRWDYIGASGSGKVITPALDRLAREGVYEREAVSPCPLTTPAHASLFTGLDVVHHGVLDCAAYRLREGPETLAEALRAKGLKTAAFVSGETLGRRYGLDRGFDVYDDAALAKRNRADWLAASRDGGAVTSAVLEYLEAGGDSSPLFIWVHYFDLHLPYRARPGLDPTYPRDPYAAQAAFVDGQIARLHSTLLADRRRSWRIVIVGDHGEGLGDKNEDTHGIGLYRATLHVPLIVWPKPDKPLRHPRPWGLVDLFPTVRAWFDLQSSPLAIDGDNLFDGGRGDRPLTAVSVESATMFGVAPVKGIRTGSYFYIRNGAEELYDLDNDPDEQKNLGRDQNRRGILESLRKIADSAWPRRWPWPALSMTAPLKDGELRNLRSLGYAAGPASSGGSFRHADLSKLLRDRSLWDKAREEAFRSGRPNALVDLLSRLTADYPDSVLLHKEFGVLLARAGRLREAITQMEEAVRLDPRDGTAQTNLGGLQLEAGRDELAESCLLKALDLDPTNPMAHKNLGILYAERRNDPIKAVEHYRAYLALDPASPDAATIQSYVNKHTP